MAKKKASKKAAAPGATGPDLGKLEVKKVQGLLLSKTAEGVASGLSLLESLGAKADDYGKIFTSKIFGAVLRGLCEVDAGEFAGGETSHVCTLRKILATLERSTDEWRELFADDDDSLMTVVADPRHFDLWEVVLTKVAAEPEDLDHFVDLVFESFWECEDDEQSEFLAYGIPRLNEVTSTVIGEMLSRYDYPIDLTDLCEMSDFAAKALSRHIALEMDLRNVRSLSDTAAKHIGKYEGELRLDGLTKISDRAAGHLANHIGPLYLNGLVSLSAKSAKALETHSWGLWLNGLAELNGRTASHLCKHRGTLSLNGIRTISTEAAKFLGQHRGNADLGSATDRMSDDASLSISRHSWDINNDAYVGGTLYLDGLTSLSDKAAETLAPHQGKLSLNGLTSLSDAAAESLSKHKGDLDLDNLPESAAANDNDDVLRKEFAEQFIASEDFFDLSDYAAIDEDAAKLFQEYLPADLGSITGVERLRAGSVLGVLGVYYERDGDNDKALQCYEKSVELHADVTTGFWGNLAQLKSKLGDDALSKAFDLYNDSFEATTFSKFCKLLKKAIKECPSYPWAYNNLAWRLATSAVDDERDGTAAVKLATKACELCDDPGMTGTLAAAYAEAGDFEQAIKLQQQVVELSPPSDIDDETAALEKYKMQEALRED